MNKRILSLCLLALLSYSSTAIAQDDTLQELPEEAPALPKIPFDGYDLSWINGQNRQTDYPLVMKNKKGETLLSASALVDCYYNYDFNNPIDNTHTNSASIGRNNEFTVNMASVGIETNYKNAIGRIVLQYGQLLSIVQDMDGSVNHGRNTSINNLKYIREAAAGYHIDKWYGLNLEMGIFMSYIGLESYVQQDNWCYQRSMPCDFTPFYFSGARAQAYLSKTWKQELWIINGWQSYNSWNQGVGLGSSSYWRPNTNWQFVANFYLAGRDTRNASDVLRFHHDHSIVGRYYNKPTHKGISQAAFSVNNHYGFQSGKKISMEDQYMMGTSVANRIWFNKNKWGLTLRGDYLTNPGSYLAFSPTPVAYNAYSNAMNEGKVLNITQATATLDFMPTQFTTFRLEYSYRNASVPYFAGRDGTTAPDGYSPVLPYFMFYPDLQKQEHRMTLVANFRL